MGNYHGKAGRVYIGVNAVADTTRWSVTETTPVADTTSQGDTGQTHLGGIPGWSARVEAIHDPADANGQGQLSNGASVSFVGYPEGNSNGKPRYSGTATVTNLTTNSDVSDAGKVSFDLTGNGALTKDTVS